MISFSEIKLAPTHKKRGGRQVYKVMEPIEVRLNGSYLCIIEKDFETDGASIPRFLHSKWKPLGRHTPAAVLHDHLLETTALPKWQVDVLFYIALRDCGVPALEASLFWFAVRLKRDRHSHQPS